MFPINAAFYIPMFYYAPQPCIVPNPQFLYPQLNFYRNSQTSFETITSFPTNTQIERKAQKQNDKSELYLPVENDQKTKDIMKKRLIKKKLEKCLDSAEEAQRLRKKLANRPKTYRTQKKMYLTAELGKLEQNEEGKRILRKRPQRTKRVKIVEQTSFKCEVQSILFDRNQEKKLQSNENQNNSAKAIKKINKRQDFYDPQAEIPMSYGENLEINKEMERKKFNLLSRKIEVKPISLQ